MAQDYRFSNAEIGEHADQGKNRYLQFLPVRLAVASLSCLQEKLVEQGDDRVGEMLIDMVENFALLMSLAQHEAHDWLRFLKA